MSGCGAGSSSHPATGMRRSSRTCRWCIRGHGAWTIGGCSAALSRLREGCRWRALPPEYGPYTTVFNRWNRWSQRGLWQRIFAALVACADPPRVTLIDSSAVKAHRSAPGARNGATAMPAIRRSAARAAGAPPSPTRSVTTKPPARDPADRRQSRRRPKVGRRPNHRRRDAGLGGHTAERTGRRQGLPRQHLRHFLAERGTAAVIPSTSSRKLAIPHDTERYKLRNVIERMFYRPNDFRGIAPQDDKTARNFLAAVCLVAAITCRA